MSKGFIEPAEFKLPDMALIRRTIEINSAHFLDLDLRVCMKNEPAENFRIKLILSLGFTLSKSILDEQVYELKKVVFV